jgi:hypothetical protein
LSAFAIFWSYVRLTTEDFPSMTFSDGVVLEKYRSSNHDYLSVRVQIVGQGTLRVEGLSLTSWDQVSRGSIVSKRCGVSDITVVKP